MSRYIDADEFKKDLIHLGFFPALVARALEKAPTADVVEVRHGHWASEVKHFFDAYGDLNVYAKGHCSECGKDYPFNPTFASEYVERPDNLIGYAHWDIDIEPIKAQVAHKARTNKNLYPFCPKCGAKMDGERREG